MAHRRPLVLLATVVGLSSGCAGGGAASTPAAPSGSQEAQADETTLKVAMFPWIPDAAGDQFAALWNHYEEGFNEAYPSETATVEVADGNYYDATDVQRWLTEDGYDLVEIDLVMLGDVLETGAIQPFRVEAIEQRFFPTAMQAAQLGGEYYAVPHLMCTYFLFSREAEVAAARTFPELKTAFAGLPRGVQQFAGNLAGSWDSTALYVESWTEQEYGAPEGAISNPVQADALVNLAWLATTCATEGTNPCTDGTYDNDVDAPAKRFAAQTASTMFGYSERLWVVLTNNAENPPQIQPSALPLGTVDKPLLFTDAFVVSSSCTGSCLNAAVDFVTYVTSDASLGYMLASEDAGEGAVPRYLLPANPSAATYGPLKDNVYYPQFMGALENVMPLPSVGVPEYKSANAAEINSIIAGANAREKKSSRTPRGNTFRVAQELPSMGL